MVPVYENINNQLDTCNNQLYGLMTITEAINENASISILFEIYKTAIQKYYQPRTVTLCVNTIRGMQAIRSTSFAFWKN